MLEKLINNVFEISHVVIPSYVAGEGGGVNKYSFVGSTLRNCEILCAKMQTMEALLNAVESYLRGSQNELEQIRKSSYPPAIRAELIELTEQAVDKLTKLYRETLTTFFSYKKFLLKSSLGMDETPATLKIFSDKMTSVCKAGFWEEKSKSTLSKLGYDKFSQELNKILQEGHEKNFEQFKNKMLLTEVKTSPKRF